MAVKIHRLEVENVKRVKAVSLEPSESGLTVIGGKNGQGKTSVLDAIAWALGGDRFKPSDPTRSGSVIPPHLRVELSNGIVVERSGDSSRLKVIDSTGNRAGQQLLNEFIEQLALDLPRFMTATSKEKAQTLLNVIGVGDKLYELETAEQTLYNQRRTIGQIADQKAKFAKEMPIYSDAPNEPVSPSELIRRQQEILARNGENQRKREQRDRFEKELHDAKQTLELAQNRYEQAMRNIDVARKAAQDLQDESTEELERDIARIEEINVKVRANMDRERAEIDAAQYQEQYENLTAQIEDVRAQKVALLDNADLPLAGLSVDHGELLYNGHAWDAMSGSEQLRVATAIVRKLNPNCGFVLLDKLEQMDTDTLASFGEWLSNEGLQVIATRVSVGDECSIVIEDGTIKPRETTPQWKAGEF